MILKCNFGYEQIKIYKSYRNIIRIIFFTILFCTNNVFSQSYIDSLLKISESKDINTKAITLAKLSEKLSEAGDLRSLEYAQQSYAFIEQIKDNNSIAFIYKAMGLGYDLKGYYSAALNYYLKAQTIYLKENNYYELLTTLNNIAIIYTNQGNLFKANEYYLKELEFAEKLKDSLSIAIAYSNLAHIQYELNNLEKAYKYLNNSLEICKKKNDYFGIGLNYNNLAEMEYHQKNLKKSEEYILNTIKYQEKAGNKFGMSCAYRFLSKILLEKKDYKGAKFNLEKALSILETTGNKFEIARTLASIGEYYSEIKDYKTSIEYLKKAIKISEDDNFILSQVDYYQVLSKVYSKIGDYKQSLEYYEKHTQLKDSIFKKEHSDKIAELNIIFENEKKEQEIKSLKQEKEIKDAQILFFIIITIIIVASLFFITILFIKRNIAYKALLKKNLEISNKEDELKKLKANANIIDEKPITEIKEEFISSKALEFQSQELLNNLIDALDNKKVYLDNKLTIDSLADMLYTNRTYLSKLINDVYGKNFNNFINEYRVSEAINIIKDGRFDNLTLEAIASKCGFNNKTTFNTFFKKITGITPSFFRKNINEIEIEKENAA